MGGSPFGDNHNNMQQDEQYDGHHHEPRIDDVGCVEKRFGAFLHKCIENRFEVSSEPNLGSRAGSQLARAGQGAYDDCAGCWFEGQHLKTGDVGLLYFLNLNTTGRVLV